MHVITRRPLRFFAEAHPDAKGAVDAWYREARCARRRTSTEIKAQHRSASIINSERVVFNLCGNRYRLIVRIDYQEQLVFIPFIGTHDEYDKVNAESI